MGFVSTTVYMIFTGFIIQGLYHRYLRTRWKDSKFILGNIIVPATWIVQYLVYIDVLPLPAMLSTIFPWIPAQTGRTWLWNSWQFWQFGGGQTLLDMPAGMAQVAFALALSYPLWYIFGIWLGRFIFGNKSYERGILWLFQPDKGAAAAPRLDPAGDESVTK